jgi:hypothetical protein
MVVNKEAVKKRVTASLLTTMFAKCRKGKRCKTILLPLMNLSDLLPLLESLYKTHVRNQELPQPGDSRQVMPPSQNAISKHMMNKPEWDPWGKSMRKSRNPRMLQQLKLHPQQIIKATSTQDLDPRPLANNEHPSILPFEMQALEPGETPSLTLKWSPLGFLSHIKRRTIGDRSLFHFGRFGFAPLSVCQFRH